MFIHQFGKTNYTSYKELEDVEDVKEEEEEWQRPWFLNKWPRTGWEYYDFMQGLILGAYSPLLGRANDGDCLSAMYDWGISNNVSYYFDKPWRHYFYGWLVLLLIIFLGGWSTYNATSTCIAQLAGYDEFNFLADNLIKAGLMP